METLEYIRCIAFAIGLGACMFAGPRTWLLAQSIIYAGYGLATYFAPNFVLEKMIMKGTIDIHHTFMTQFLGSQLLASAVVCYFSRQSSNKAVANSPLVIATIVGVVMLECDGIAYQKAIGEKQTFLASFVSLGLWPVLLLTAGNFYHTIKSASYGGGLISLGNCISVHIFIDILMVVTGMVLDYAFPEYTLSFFEGSKPDGIHVYLIQNFAALSLSQVLQGLNAFTHPDDKDKRIYLLGRITMLIFSVPIAALAQWKHGVFSQHSLYVCGLSTVLMTVNVLWGYFRPVSLPKFKQY